MPKNHDPNNIYARLWRFYSAGRDCDNVTRSGFGLCGFYPYPADPSVAHQESVSDHSLGAVRLMALLSMFCPWLFMPNGQAPKTSQEIPEMQMRAFRLCFLLMNHDLGEVAYGDRPDDGSQNRSEKDDFEQTRIREIANNLPGTYAGELYQDFRTFCDPTNPDVAEGFGDFYLKLVQLARLCDKFDATLKAAHFEKCGYQGDLMHKKEHFGGITKQDECFIALAGGDSSVVATWTAHLVHDYYDYYGFYEIMSVMREAVIDVRGDWFPWWNDACQQLGISDYGW